MVALKNLLTSIMMREVSVPVTKMSNFFRFSGPKRRGGWATHKRNGGRCYRFVLVEIGLLIKFCHPYNGVVSSVESALV